MCTISRARKIIMAIWLFGVIYSSPWLFLTQTSPYPDHMHMEYCHYRLTRKEYVYFYLADIVLFYVLPLLASITLYVRIAVALRISILHMPGKVTITRSYSPASSNSNLARPLTVRSPQAWRKHNYRNTDEKRAVVQVVQMLFVIVLLFATLWFPYRALLVYNSFVSKPYLNLWYLLFAKTTVFINSAINPLLYNAMSKRFRRAFLLIVFKKGGSSEPTWMQMSTSSARTSRLLRATSRSMSEVSYSCASNIGLDGISRQPLQLYAHKIKSTSPTNEVTESWTTHTPNRTHSQSFTGTQCARICRRSITWTDLQPNSLLKPPFQRSPT
ncbi:hypothetical protein RvY_03600-1 [Ramazzottius varieornatus]|uniref:Thyrotropin-releasing hormone receptor n=1 Tax=Ramazzottius varieornatus TaxID=947166 RepID=A0A1D1UYT6_RAMVA|nr:hypothetical protein RvY_03600-1 [Ramazzottius varieornatus]